MNHLRVELGHDGTTSVEPASRSITATDDFTIEFYNDGHPRHVHVAPEGDLGRFVEIEASNHFIEEESLRVVSVAVAEDRPETFMGKLRIVTGYGTDTTYIDVTLEEAVEPEREVVVDESLGRPQPEPDVERPALADRVGSDALPVIALAVMAVLIAAGATMIATDAAVVIGILAVMAGVAVALAILVR